MINIVCRAAELRSKFRAIELFWNDSNSLRPPPIPEAPARRENTKKGSNSTSKGKYTKAYFNTARELAVYVSQHNENHSSKPEMQYRWYPSGLDTRSCTTTLMRVVEHIAPGLLGEVYGTLTYDKAHRIVPNEVEMLVLEAATRPEFNPLTQGARLFPVRKLVAAKMYSKEKVVMKAKKREQDMTKHRRTTAAVLDIPKMSNSHEGPVLSRKLQNDQAHILTEPLEEISPNPYQAGSSKDRKLNRTPKRSGNVILTKRPYLKRKIVPSSVRPSSPTFSNVRNRTRGFDDTENVPEASFSSLPTGRKESEIVQNSGSSEEQDLFRQFQDWIREKEFKGNLKLIDSERSSRGLALTGPRNHFEWIKVFHVLGLGDHVEIQT